MHAVGRLHVITDVHLQSRWTHEQIARAAAHGGADAVQFRHKAGGVRDKLRLLRPVAQACRDGGVALVVNDHLSLALALEAAGVHLGQDDLPIADARRVLGDDFIIGATATTTDQAKQAADEGASYVGFGPVYHTNSKVGSASVKGLGGLGAACRAVGIPVIAIGGVKPHRVDEVLSEGAYGVAVLSAVTASPDPSAATGSFRRAIDQSLAQRA